VGHLKQTLPEYFFSVCQQLFSYVVLPGQVSLETSAPEELSVQRSTSGTTVLFTS